MSYKKIAIVDGFSTGVHLAKLIKSKGHQCIHILSNPVIPDCFKLSYNKTLFSQEVVHDKSLENTVDTLKKIGLDFIFPGNETGVELADSLSEALGLLSNGTKLSSARRDKYLMVEALRAKNIPTVEHIKSDQLSGILDWVLNRNEYPIVIKPVKSASADAVTICNNQTEIINAFHKIVGKTNQLGLYNAEAIAQTFLNGTEYIVNTVSADGQHYICDIWKCRKTLIPNAGYISCLEELLPYEGEIQKSLIDYTVKVLEALGIMYGPAHFEIMMTDAGPILIEVGARLQGSINPSSISLATGTNQVELTLEAYLDPEVFIKKLKSTYQIKKYMYHLFMVSNTEGVFKGLNKFDRIQSLQSFFHHVQRIEIGSKLPRTIDLISSVGFIDLIHEDAAQLENDYRKYREIEHDSLFET